jgi:hypothetical protein
MCVVLGFYKMFTLVAQLCAIIQSSKASKRAAIGIKDINMRRIFVALYNDGKVVFSRSSSVVD